MVQENVHPIDRGSLLCYFEVRQQSRQGDTSENNWFREAYVGNVPLCQVPGLDYNGSERFIMGL